MSDRGSSSSSDPYRRPSARPLRRDDPNNDDTASLFSRQRSSQPNEIISSDPLAFSDGPTSPHTSDKSGSIVPLARMPKAARPDLPSASSSRGRRTPVVEIPLLPLEDVRSYRRADGRLNAPDSRSRSRLPGISSSTSLQTSRLGSSSRSHSAAPTPAVAKRKNKGWKVSSSPSFEDEDELDGRSPVSDQGSELDFLDGSDSDDIALRRSDRAGAKMGRQSRDGKQGKISSRTRRNRPAISRSPSIVSLSSDTDDDAHGHARRPAKESSKMAERRNKPLNRQRRSETDISVVSIGSGSRTDDLDYSVDELDELEDEESDFDPRHPGRRKGKGKAKAKGKELQAEVEEDVVYAHRPFCEKCLREPADDMLERAQARKMRAKGKKRKRDDDKISDDELAADLEGWLECSNCVVSSHWGCLAPSQKKDVLLALLNEEGPPLHGSKPRRSVKIDETFIFTCARCATNPKCFVCHEDNGSKAKNEKTKDNGEKMDEQGHAVVDLTNDEDKPTGEDDEEKPRMFRCLRCKQCVHYKHLDAPRSLGDSPPLKDIANHYQTRSAEGDAWFCHQCRGWVWTVDIIIAWRPSPPEIKEPELEPDEKANWKDPLPREYLVKWTGRGFRHVTWVPHAWLQVTSAAKLRIFLEKGPALDLVTDETLAARGDEMAQPTIAALTAEEDKSTSTRKGHGHAEDQKKQWVGMGPGPEVDAEASLPIEWSTIDRVLDVVLLPPSQPKKKKPVQRQGQRIVSASPTPTPSESASAHAAAATAPDGSASQLNVVEEKRLRLGLKDGIKPPEDMMLDIDSYEEQTGREFDQDDVEEVAGMVTWCFVKWDDLQYDQCELTFTFWQCGMQLKRLTPFALIATWDTPPPTSSFLYPAFKSALARYLRARRVDIPVLTPAECKQRERDAEKAYVPPTEQPECIVGGKLMPFQMEGFQWLLYKHFRRESCILADDMGLGKTIQIASVLGYLGSVKYNIHPCLVVVPNSTITNWVREFEKWVPHLRVVPYYGEAASRKIISKYELYHKGMQGKAAGLKAHIVVTTYDMITGSEFRVFGGVPRWEILCIDEGQRLKSDSNLIFNRLKTLNSVHRILMTGTPLNNNLRELFNLLNFLDPVEFSNLEKLEERFLNLNESLVQELHEMIKPYILRRIKADVLKLPPKIEIIVPISLTPLQKQVYKGVFERNADLIQAILQARKKKIRAGASASASASAIAAGSRSG